MIDALASQSIPTCLVTAVFPCGIIFPTVDSDDCKTKLLDLRIRLADPGENKWSESDTKCF